MLKTWFLRVPVPVIARPKYHVRFLCDVTTLTWLHHNDGGDVDDDDDDDNDDDDDDDKNTRQRFENLKTTVAKHP